MIQNLFIFCEQINNFVKAIEEEDLKISAKPQKQVKLEESYQGILKDEVFTLIQLSCNYILLQIVDAVSRGDSQIQSYYLKDRDPMSCWDRTAISFTYLWYTQWKPFLIYIQRIYTNFYQQNDRYYQMLALALIFTGLSILVLVAELLYCFGVKNDILYNLLVATDLDAASNYIVDNIVCLIPLIYLIATTNYGLFKLRLSKIYALHPNHHTDPGCLLYSCLFIMRLSIPIVYNFYMLSYNHNHKIITLICLNKSIIISISLIISGTSCCVLSIGPTKQCEIYGGIFQQICVPSTSYPHDLIDYLQPLQQAYFVTNYIRFLKIKHMFFFQYIKLMNCIGLRLYAFDNDYQEDKIEDGKKIIENYRNDKLLMLGNRKSGTHSGGSKKKILPDMDKPRMSFNKRKNVLNSENLDSSDTGNEIENGGSSSPTNNNFNSDNDQSRMSARMSTTTFNMDDDEEENTRKGVKGFFKQAFTKSDDK